MKNKANKRLTTLKKLEKKLAAKLLKKRFSKSSIRDYKHPQLEIRESSNEQWSPNVAKHEVAI